VIIAVMRHAGTGPHAARLRALIVVLRRAGLRIHEALALGEADLDPRRGSLLVRHGKGGRRREVGMDDWAWEQLQPWFATRVDLPAVRCCVSPPALPADAPGPRGPRVRSCATPPRGLVCAGASHPTSSATRTPWRWLAKASR
jgi:integrase